MSVACAGAAILALKLGESLPPGFTVQGSGPVTAIETPADPSPLEAALILRAVLRFEPRSVTFLDPLGGVDGAPLLKARLDRTNIPVRFAPATTFTPPAGVVPPTVSRVDLDGLLVRIEAVERGETDPELAPLFRGRPVFIETAGRGHLPAAAIAIIPSRRVPLADWLGVLLAATLPWWPVNPARRWVVAGIVGGIWALLAVTLQPEFHVALPIAIAPLLPALALLLLALKSR